MSSRAKSSLDSKLWLALRFPDLPLNVLGVESQPCTLAASIPAGQERALVVSQKQRVICANQQALEAGITYAMDITTARLLSDCELLEREPALETQALEQLSEQLYQFTPYIEPYTCPSLPQAGLLLELSSCLALFSGIKNLSQLIFNFLQNTVYGFAYGLAHSAQAAWLLSFADYPIAGNENKTLFCERLERLPVDLLQGYPKVVEALEKTGFDNLGDIARQIKAQSISSIKKRFGIEFANYLCAVFGIDQDFQQASLFEKPATMFQPAEFFMDTLQFDYPVNQVDQLRLPMETMLEKLSNYLRKRQLECQRIEWMLYDIYRNSEKLLIYSDNAQSSGKLLHELTQIQLEQKQLPFAVDTLELRCHETQPIQNRSQALDFNQTSRGDKRTQNFAITAAKLKARLGDSAVFKLSYCDSHFPEISNTPINMHEPANQQMPMLHLVALRPAWLFPAPVVIEERAGGLYWRGYLTLLIGPERIQGNWWKTPLARDYFLAQRSDHLRLWVYQDLHSHSWFVQGIFG